MDNVQLAQVVVEIPARDVNQTFDYLIPDGLEEWVVPGSRVIVPFGPRKVQGFVLQTKNVSQRASAYELKTIESVLDETPPLTKELLELGRWMSEKYVCLLITALQAMLPSALRSRTYKSVRINKDGQKEVTYHVKDGVTTKKVAVVRPLLDEDQLRMTVEQLPPQAKKQKEIVQFLCAKSESIPLNELVRRCRASRSTVKALEQKGIVEIVREEQKRNPYAGRTFQKTTPLPLTEEQHMAFQKMAEAIDREEHRTFLLHGVTGSGKTEIYLQAIARVLAQGKEAIVLVPEISLTPQMVERFKGRFGDQVAVIHSRLSAGERYDEWLKIHERQVKVAIGARSALFAPFQNIGLIIIDEEHESSYKQEESPKYHARDVAIYRGEYHRAPVILGSATPALESYARAEKGVYQLVRLRRRVHGRSLPPVRIVDMRKELRAGNRSMFSRTLYQNIQDRLERKEQVVLFLNRRGFSTFVMCRDCGYVLSCPHCEISLTFHKVDRTLRCHYCGYQQKMIDTCPECHSAHIRFFGTGTQKVEEELYKHFPGIRVIRMDVDTTRRKGAHEAHLRAFGNHEADVLLGTQMIAKGLDFANVTLVGVMAADALLHLPDFRAAEKTFQLLTQVSGRAGRHQLPGEVIVQSYTPEHYSIQQAAKYDYVNFYRQEMHYRRQHGYPPYYFITLMTFSHEDLTISVRAAEQSVSWLKQRLNPQTIVLGPVASPIPKIKDRYRYHCMIKYRNEPKLAHIINELLTYLTEWRLKKKLLVQIDMQPLMFM